MTPKKCDACGRDDRSLAPIGTAGRALWYCDSEDRGCYDRAMAARQLAP